MSEVLVVVRPPASEALYHRFENELFDQLLSHLAASPNTTVVLLPRNDEQRQRYAKRAAANLIVPSKALDGANLIAYSDLVISGGGTMNREAAALGTPAGSIYAGAWAAIDEDLVKEGRLLKITTLDDIYKLRLEKKISVNARARVGVLKEVADLILE